jgi:UDP-GlcNAc:undecaprenyl-phosphate GlcNAc-1-phosphate transferase
MVGLEVIKLIIFLIIINLSFFTFYNYIESFLNIFDNPDKIRKFHLKKISVLGGLFIYFSILASTLFLLILGEKTWLFNFSEFKFIIFIIFLSLVFFLGLYDDKFTISPNKRLIILTVILLSFLYVYPEFLVNEIKFSFLQTAIKLKFFSLFFTLVCFLLFINAFNMLDGINLQVGFYTVINLLYFFTFNQDLLFLTTVFIPILFYLLLNYKNKTFLGDGGAYLLSFILSCFFLKNYNSNYILADNILIFMLYPGLEIIRLFFLRLINNKHPFSSDRNHLHHYLIKKIGFLKTFLLIQFLIAIPIIQYLYNLKIFAFFFGIISYLLIILICGLKKFLKSN